MSSEFGKGLTYCLGLFLAHAERIPNPVNKDDVGSWFYASGDHLYEFLPEQAPKHLIERCKKFKDEVLAFRNSFLTEIKIIFEDRKRLIQEAKDLLLEIDKANGITTEKAEFE